VLLSASYDFFENSRFSIPVELGYRLPLHKRYRYSDGFVSIDDGTVFFERIEKSGEGRFLQVGLKYKF
jgi:hypothetical protein